jgi:hypothetical protein
MRTILLVLGVGAVVLLALGWAGRAWGQAGNVPPFSITQTGLPLGSVTTQVNTNTSASSSQGPILILPPGTDPELVLRAVAVLRGTPAILPDSVIVPGTPLDAVPAPTGGAVDTVVVATPVPVPVPVPVVAPTPPPRVLIDPPMANPGPNPKTISLF